MRTLSALVLTIAMVCAGCSGGSADRTTSAVEDHPVTLESLRLDWPKAQGRLVVPRRPATPDGFNDATLTRMAGVLKEWARVAAVDDMVWHSADPLADLTQVLPDRVAAAFAKRIKSKVSPHLGAANVFGKDVTVVGTPMVTAAWEITQHKDGDGRPYVRLALQTRAAYQVRTGGGPDRVIGMLRVHTLSAYEDTADEFGVGGGWQEFGAADCALALDDALEPDSDRADSLDDLEAFIRIGKSKKLQMPDLPVQEKVDAEYLKRCREGAV